MAHGICLRIAQYISAMHGANSIYTCFAISITDKIGRGEFGDVSKGCWKWGDYSMEVAVKSLCGEQTHENRVKLLQEAAITSQFRHPNVIKLYGVVSGNNQVRHLMQFKP